MPDLGYLTRHERLIVTLTRRTEVRGPVENASLVLEDAADCARFFQLGRDLGVEGLVVSALRRTPGIDRPPVVERELQSRWDHLRRQAILWDLERERVLHALHRKGVSPVLLKGSALREMAYQDPVDRSMGDLDFLVSPPEIEDAMIALRAAGYASDLPHILDAYRQYHFHYPLTHPRGFIVELHWALAEPASHTGLSAEEFLARSITIRRGNSLAVRVPSPEDLLLHVVSQNAGDAFGLLRRVADLDRILARSPRLDWNYIGESARKAGLDMVLAVSLRLSELLLGTTVPASFAPGLELPWLSRIHIALLQPVSWVVSPLRDRRPAALEVLQLWSARPLSHHLRLLTSTAWGTNPVADVIAGIQPSRKVTFRSAMVVMLRLAKLAAYQLQVYSRSGVALATRTGRNRLHFW
jgi:hypothetical protein